MISRIGVVSGGLHASSFPLTATGEILMVHTATLSSEVVYVVMQEDGERDLVTRALSFQTYALRTVLSVDAFLDDLAPTAVGCVIAPVDLADNGIRKILASLRARRACLALCALGREHDFPTAVDLIKLGASEFVEQPLTAAKILAAVRRAVEASHVAYLHRPPLGAKGSG